MPVDAPLRRAATSSSATRTVGVVLVDDHARYREGLERRLRQDDRFDVLGHADSVTGAAAAVGALRPDVAVIDLHLADGDVLDVVAALAEGDLASRLLVLSADAGGPRARFASTVLGRPVLSKELPRRALADAIAAHAERVRDPR